MRKKQPKANHNPSNAKIPRSASTPETSKVPRSRAPDMKYTDNPAWRLKTLDFGGPWCPRKMSHADLLRVVNRMQDLETMTWQEILVGGRKENHQLVFTDLSKKAQDRLQLIKLDDVDDVISLRVTGRARLFGVRFGSLLRLLWWDPEHEVCPSTKKHT